VAAQADGIVLDLHSVAHIRDHAHVTAFLVLTRSRKVLSRTTDARRKAWGTASGECRICPAAVRLSALFTVLGVNQVSCASPGNCAATGNYTGAQDHNQAFVADEKNGTWGGAIEVPGSGALNGFGRAQVLSSRAHRRATAPRAVPTSPRTTSAWRSCQRGERHLGGARNVPGIVPLAKGGLSDGRYLGVVRVAGNCAAGGFILNAGGGHAFLADQSTAPTMSAGQPTTASGGQVK
jgi:hypothetical protein